MSDADGSTGRIPESPARDRAGGRREFALALLLETIGAGAALAIALQTWQVVTTPRPRPLRDDVLALSGRNVDAAPTALALVALAGVVAVLATRGQLRRLVGVVIAIAGAVLAWRSLLSAGAVSVGRARTLVADHHQTVSTRTGVLPTISVHSAWPVLSIACGVLVAVAGALIAWRGQRWQGMSAKYEVQPAVEEDPAKVATSMWRALDRGEDPTSRERG